MNYRPEIDGMRALAVIPVILFHAGLEPFSGGYVGVDVFFVISGYLITSLLVEDIQKQQFSLLKFYERRARRILPALFLVVLVCIPFSLVFMLPEQLSDFFQSVAAVSLFVSNIIFTLQGGYFSNPAEEAPLLHTWSLAVEEQFYVLFPIFLVIVWRFGQGPTFWTIAAISALSLALSEWGWRNQATANFYLAPTRAWELLAGSMAALIIQRTDTQKSEALGALGLLLIVGAIIFYDETTPFPSLYTLVPVIGTVLVIFYANTNTLVRRLLSTKVLVGIGLISYSAYLWHQPLFAFARLALIEDPSTGLMIALSIVSLVLGYLSWSFVEQPFRNPNFLKRGQIFSLTLVTTVTLSIGVILMTGPIINRIFGEKARNLLELSEASNLYVWREKRKLNYANFDDANYNLLIIGDSWSGDLINILDTVLDKDSVDMSSITIHAGCGALYLDFDIYSDFISDDRMQKCRGTNSLLSKKSQSLLEEADAVIFASSWMLWQVQFLEETAEQLELQFGQKFWWVGEKAVSFPRDEQIFQKNFEFENFSNPAKTSILINKKIATILGDKFIDLYSYFCRAKKCRLLDDNGNLIFYDGSHLTEFGAAFLGRQIVAAGYFGPLSANEFLD